MKGRREELIKSELHQYLKDRLGVEQVHSEYGMTELLSQAYSIKDGLFKCPPWMKVLVSHDRSGGGAFDTSYSDDFDIVQP